MEKEKGEDEEDEDEIIENHEKKGKQEEEKGQGIHKRRVARRVAFIKDDNNKKCSNEKVLNSFQPVD